MATQELDSGLPAASAPAGDNSKFKSPPPPTPSMTPPPTSDATLLASHLARTPSPSNHLSSPPPTAKSPLVFSLHTSSDSSNGMYSPEQVARAPVEELRTMVEAAMAACREARTATAHHKLQYQLLCMESSEAMKRMQVELEMTQKEVEVLQHRGNSALATPVLSAHNAPRTSSPNDRIILDLRNAYQLIEVEKDHLRRRLSDARAALLDREDTLLDKIESLEGRIRENRAHMVLFRQSIPTSNATPTTTFGTPFVTPMTSLKQEPKTPNNPRPSSTTAKTQGDQAFAALLLADQVLSQEAATTPSASTSRHSKPHTRANIRAAPLASPVQLAAPQTPSKVPGPYFLTPSNPARTSRNSTNIPQNSANPAYQNRRRISRDSTISASDLEDRNESSDEESVALDVSSRVGNEPQTPLSGRKPALPSTPVRSVAPKSAPLGSVKAYASRAAEKLKRKAKDEGSSEVKKLKLNEGFGLGIGGLENAPQLAE